jgi:hypothetical protein
LQTIPRRAYGIAGDVVPRNSELAFFFLFAIGFKCGPQFLLSLREAGRALVAGSLSVTILPHCNTLLLGR